MSRADEWHIKVRQETRRRLKGYAGLAGLTLDAALNQLLDLAALRVSDTEQTRAVRDTKRRTPKREAA